MIDLPTLIEWAPVIGVAALIISVPMAVARYLATIDAKHKQRYYLGGGATCLLLIAVEIVVLVNIGFPGTYQAPLRGAAVGWTSNDFCVVESDGLHIKRLTTQVGLSCLAPFQEVSDADISVHVRQIDGSTNVLYGLIFRYHDTGSTNSYEFVLDGSGQWFFTKIVEGQFFFMQPGATAPAIHQGLGADNQLEVQAQGTHFTFSINGARVGAFDDASLFTGVVGVTTSSGCEVVFSNFQVTAR